MFHQCPLTYRRPHIFLGTLLSNALSIFSRSLPQYPHLLPYQNTHLINVLYSFVLVFPCTSLDFFTGSEEWLVLLTNPTLLTPFGSSQCLLQFYLKYDHTELTTFLLSGPDLSHSVCPALSILPDHLSSNV